MKIPAVVIVIVFFFATSIAQVTFQKTFGKASDNWGYSVQQTTDGGYIIAGLTGSLFSFENVYLIKTDDNGDSLWTKAFTDLGDAEGRSVQQTSDGGYVIAGTSDGVLLVKTDTNGNNIWTKVFGIGGFGRSVQQTTDGGFIIVGYTVGERDVYVIKTDENGDSLWTKTFGGTGSDRGYSVQQTSDGGYIIAGETLTDDGGYWDIYLVKTDANGNIIWEKTFGGTDLDSGNFGQQTNDGGYIVTGHIYRIGGALIKTDENGDSVWMKIIGDSLFRGNSVKQTSDNGYIIAGTRGTLVSSQNTDCVLIKTDFNGNTMWTRTFGGAGDDFGECVQLTDDGGYIITGSTSSFGAVGIDVYLIKTDANGNAAPFTGIENQHFRVPNVMIYPNPNDGYFTVILNPPAVSDIAIQITNIRGQVVKTESHKNSQTLYISLNNQQAGIYFVKLITNETVITTKKIVAY